MEYDFDTELPLRGHHTSKYDGIARFYGTDHPDMIAMWVADMDFAMAKPIRDALKDEIDFGYMGYFTDTSECDAAIADWMENRHGWTIDPRTIRYTHGVIGGYGAAIAAYSQPGDGVIVFSPVYHAFFRQIEAMGRVAVESRLIERDGQYHMDLEALASQLTGSEKVLTFCSPHNPGGRVWSANEIRELAAFCEAHDLLFISDEIHGDMTHEGQNFVPALVAAPQAASRTVILSAASKSFNTAGLETGYMIIPDADVRKRIDAALLDRESSPTRTGIVATQAAYEHCGDWLEAVRSYIFNNFRIFAERMNALPGISVMPMQATYLAWVDFSDTGMDPDEIEDRLLNTAHVATNPGRQFRGGCDTHMRFNLALPRGRLMRALDGIEKAFSDLQ